MFLFIGLSTDIYRIIFQVVRQPQAQVSSEHIRILETGSGHLSGQFRTILRELIEERFRWTSAIFTVTSHSLQVGTVLVT